MGATPATDVAGASARLSNPSGGEVTPITRVDTSHTTNSSQSGHSGSGINRMHTTMNTSGLAGEAPSLFHQGSRHSLSAGERPVTFPSAPPAPINFVRKDSDPSGRPVLGDNASTQSQSGGRLSVVSPIAGALSLDTVDFQGEDSAGVQCTQGSVVKRGSVYYSVGMDGMSLTQISDSPMSGRRSQVVLQLEQRDLQHILEVGQVTYRGGEYTFAGHNIHPIEVKAGKQVRGGCCSAGVVEDPTYHVTLTEAAREEPSYTMHGDASAGQDHHVELKETKINITELEPFQE